MRPFVFSSALVLIGWLMAQTAFTQNIDTSAPGIKALVIASSRLGANYNFNIDDLEEYGFELVVAGPTPTVSPCSWAAPLGLQPLLCDTLLDQIAGMSPWDAMIIMPASWRQGNAYQDLIGSDHFMGLVREADSLHQVIYATCAGPRVLKAAGIVSGRKVTGIVQIKTELISGGAIWMGSDTLPVIDSNFVTSTRGMFYHTENMEAVTTALEMTAGKKGPSRGLKWTTRATEHPGGDILWSETYGAEGSEGINAMIQTIDGGLLLAGYTWSAGNGNADFLLVKTDQNGNEQWMKTIGSGGWEYAYALCAGIDGGYYVAGYTSGYGAESKDILMVKTDAEGNEEWHKIFGGADIDVAKSVNQASDGSVLICGYTQSPTAGEDDILLLKTDSEGNLVWIRTYGGNSSEQGRQVLINSSGQYMVLGSTGSWGAGNKDIWLACTDTAGTLMWSKTYGNEGYQECYAMIETEQGGYLISGQTDIHSSDFLNMYLVKTDPSGNRIWDKQYESPANFYEYGRDICRLSDGTYAICGNLKYPVDRTNDLYICKIDTSGTLLWSESFGGSASDWGNAICGIGNNDIIVAGHTFSYGAGLSDAWLVRVHLPMVGTPNPLGEESGLKINNCLPNPFSKETTIDFEVPHNRTATLKICSSSGVVYRTMSGFTEGHHQVIWDGTSGEGAALQSGLYLFLLECGNDYRLRKVVNLR